MLTMGWVMFWICLSLSMAGGFLLCSFFSVCKSEPGRVRLDGHIMEGREWPPIVRCDSRDIIMDAEGIIKLGQIVDSYKDDADKWRKFAADYKDGGR